VANIGQPQAGTLLAQWAAGGVPVVEKKDPRTLYAKAYEAVAKEADPQSIRDIYKENK
jgi:hypothetical protein